MNSEARLQNIETRIAKIVCNVGGFVTKAEIELRDTLRAACGKQWDAINRQWRPLEAEVR